MSYPETSNFVSGAPRSAWWYHQSRGSEAQVCQMTGFDLLADTQSILREELLARGPLPAWDRAVSANDISVVDWTNGRTVGTGWDETLLRALYALGMALGQQDSGLLDSIQLDAQSRTIGQATVLFAIWLSQHSRGFRGDVPVVGLGNPLDIGIPSGAILPPWGSVPAPPTNLVRGSGADCRLVSALGGAPVQPVEISTRVGALAVIGVLLAGVIAAGILTRKAPRQVEIRALRRNPSRRRGPVPGKKYITTTLIYGYQLTGRIEPFVPSIPTGSEVVVMRTIRVRRGPMRSLVLYRDNEYWVDSDLLVPSE